MGWGDIMEYLYQRLIVLYPELKNPGDDSWFTYITLQNDGQGDYIKHWSHPTLAKPTEEQLLAVEPHLGLVDIPEEYTETPSVYPTQEELEIVQTTEPEDSEETTEPENSEGNP